jgi:hypothetical protein
VLAELAKLLTENAVDCIIYLFHLAGVDCKSIGIYELRPDIMSIFTTADRNQIASPIISNYDNY